MLMSEKLAVGSFSIFLFFIRQRFHIVCFLSCTSLGLNLRGLCQAFRLQSFHLAFCCIRAYFQSAFNIFVPKIFKFFFLIYFRSERSKREFFIKLRAAFLLSPSFIAQGRMGARKAALILMNHFHFDRTPQKIYS